MTNDSLQLGRTGRVAIRRIGYERFCGHAALVDFHEQGAMVALLAPLREGPNLYPLDPVHPRFGNEAIVDVKRLGFIPLMVVGGRLLTAMGLRPGRVVSADQAERGESADKCGVIEIVRMILVPACI